jgi:hypothetical protein
MIELYENDVALRFVLEETMHKFNLDASHYDMEEMVKSFSNYLNDDIGQVICDKAKCYIEDGFHIEYEKEP